MLKWIKSHYLLATVIILIAAFALYRISSGNKVAYQEYVVSKGGINNTLELSGKIQAATAATLRFPTGGLLTYVGAKEGDTVKKWQTLASIDTRQLQKTLDQKLNLYAIARGTFEQTIDDNDNSVPDQDLGRELKRILEKNQYQLDNTVKDVEYLDLSLKLSRLTSPLAGILIHAPVDTANVQVLATDTWQVVDPTSLYFSADLDETDLKRVSVGQKVIISLDAYPDHTYESKISSISFSPKETSSGTTYEIKVEFPEFVKDFRLGLNGTATIILEEKQGATLLPSSAISFEGGKAEVLLKEGKKYTKRELQVGIENEGMVEIISGVDEGNRVYIEKN